MLELFLRVWVTTTGGMTAAQITRRMIKAKITRDRRDLRHSRLLTCFSDMVQL